MGSAVGGLPEGCRIAQLVGRVNEVRFRSPLVEERTVGVEGDVRDWGLAEVWAAWEYGVGFVGKEGLVREG